MRRREETHKKNLLKRRQMDQLIHVTEGLVKGREDKQKEGERKEEEKPIILVSMFGNTTPCVDHARKILESRSVLFLFHFFIFSFFHFFIFSFFHFLIFNF